MLFRSDFAEILQGKTPDIWISNAPAKTGDTGALFKRIIDRALTTKAPAKRVAKTRATSPKATKARKT